MMINQHGGQRHGTSASDDAVPLSSPAPAWPASASPALPGGTSHRTTKAGAAACGDAGGAGPPLRADGAGADGGGTGGATPHGEHRALAGAATFGRAVQLNNAGAAHLERGDWPAAARALTAALSAFQRALVRAGRTLPSLLSLPRHEQDDCRRTMLEGGSNNIEHFLLLMPSHCRGGRGGCRPDDDDVVMYGDPIRLPPDYVIARETCVFVVTAVTFNLALAYHSLGVVAATAESCGGGGGDGESVPTIAPALPISSRTRHQQRLLEKHRRRRQQLSEERCRHGRDGHCNKAVRLYEQVLRLEVARAAELRRFYHEAGRAGGAGIAATLLRSGGGGGGPLLGMAVLNNLGHLHRLAGRPDLSRECYRRLLGAVMHGLRGSHHGGEEGEGEEERPPQGAGGGPSAAVRARNPNDDFPPPGPASAPSASWARRRLLLDVYLENTCRALPHSRQSASAA
jgi:hypothetical protein